MPGRRVTAHVVVNYSYRRQSKLRNLTEKEFIGRILNAICVENDHYQMASQN